jgi:hypothetical protein
MIIESEAFDSFLDAVANREKLENLEGQKKVSFRQYIYELAYPLGCLRLANKRYVLGLSFKPEKPEGNPLKYAKFICEKKCEFLGNDVLINTVWEYSKNRGSEVASKQVMMERLEEVLAERPDSTELVNGHDAAQIISLLSKNGLGSVNAGIRSADCVEDMLAMSFDLRSFSKTKLYESIKKWEEKSGAQLLNKS